MLESHRLKIEEIRIQEKINDPKFLEIRSDDDDAEQRIGERNALTVQLSDKRKEIIGALETEDREAQVAMARHVDPEGMTKELREFRDVAQRTDFETYFKASVLGVEIREGPEYEYNKHVFGNEWGLGDIPLEMFLDRDELVEPEVLKHVTERYGSKEYEKRTAITGTSNDAGNLTYVDRLFADSDGAYIGTSYPAVGPGRHSFPIVTSTVGSQATAVARGTQQTPAGGITIANADPESIRAAFTIANVDELVMPGIGNYLMSDIRAHLMSGLDNKVIDDVVTALTAVASAHTDDAVMITLAKLFQKFGQTVDGVAAKSVNDVRMLVAGTPAATGTLCDMFRARGGQRGELFHAGTPRQIPCQPALRGPCHEPAVRHSLQDGAAPRHARHRGTGLAAREPAQRPIQPVRPRPDFVQGHAVCRRDCRQHAAAPPAPVRPSLEGT